MKNFLCQMCVMKKRVKRQVPFILQTCHDILEEIGFWKLQFYGDTNARLSWYSDRHICKTNTFIWILERKTFHLLYTVLLLTVYKKRQQNMRAACTISHTSRQTNKFIIHEKLFKCKICTLHGWRDNSHIWVGKLLFVCVQMRIL